MVSHELRSPLTTIMGGVEIILDGYDGLITEKQKEHLQIVKRQCDRLTHLISEVLDYQKMESGLLEFKMQPTQINDLISEALKDFSPEAEKKGLTLKSQLAPDLPQVPCDRGKIVQMLVNFLDNAIKFSDRDSITTKTFQNDSEVKIEV